MTSTKPWSSSALEMRAAGEAAWSEFGLLVTPHPSGSEEGHALRGRRKSGEGADELGPGLDVGAQRPVGRRPRRAQLELRAVALGGELAVPRREDLGRGSRGRGVRG